MIPEGISNKQYGIKYRKNWSKKERTQKTKATAMSRGGMVELVRLVETYDYDGKLRNYNKLNACKDRILDEVIKVINKKHGILRSKDLDLKHREHEQLQKMHQINKRKTKQKIAKRTNHKSKIDLLASTSGNENEQSLERSTGSSSKYYSDEQPSMETVQAEEIIELSPPQHLSCKENHSFQKISGQEMQSHNQDSGLEVWEHSPSESNINVELIDITA